MPKPEPKTVAVATYPSGCFYGVNVPLRVTIRKTRHGWEYAPGRFTSGTEAHAAALENVELYGGTVSREPNPRYVDPSKRGPKELRDLLRF